MARKGYYDVDHYTEYDKVQYSYDAVLPLAQQNHTSATDYDLEAIQSRPFAVNETMYAVYFPTISQFRYQIESGEIYGRLTIWYWFGLVSFAVCRRMLESYYPSTSMRLAKLFQLLRKHVVLPSLFGNRHTVPLTWFRFPLGFLPTRMETVILTIYFVINTVLLCINYTLFNNNTYWPNDKLQQLLRYASDRSGIIAMVQLPVVVLFAGRNNVLQWATGWSFQSFMLYHRWIARVMFLNATVHSFGYSVYSLKAGIYLASFGAPYWCLGVVATTVCALLVVHSIYYLRHHWYELFLFLHIVLVAVFLVTLYLHLHLLSLGYYGYIWLSAALWSIDRLVRIARILLFGLAPSGYARVIAPEIFELRLQTKSFLKPSVPEPGSYSYIHFARFKPWESHPFSLVEYDQTRGTYVYLCKAFDGITKDIYRYLEAQPGQSASLAMAQDGMYGSKTDLDSYEKVIFVAGGIGITPVIQYAKALKKHQHFVLHWITHYESEIDTLLEELNLSDTSLELHTHTTQFGDSPRLYPIGYEKSVSVVEKAERNLRVHHNGRPDIEKLLSSEVRRANCSVAVFTCGPPTLNDACRNITARLATQGHQGSVVDYFEESFFWA
ncbi:ferric reductase like transmembrane component-domain-containing protein [Dipodascopsis tothii]|uniref:ferric reductase like transmembrane component-domain-containing protein n=1 Tax=Dipodascopsis tothii TaxID=44089 RepID=UPI0034CE235D